MVGDVLGTVIPDLNTCRSKHAMRTHMNFVLSRGSNGMFAPGPRRKGSEDARLENISSLCFLSVLLFRATFPYPTLHDSKKYV